MSAVWTAEAAEKATGGTLLGSDWVATGVSIDSRTVQPGDLFVALKGPAHDGHDHVGAALGKGAAAALIHHLPADLAPDAHLLRVADSLEGLRALARAARARSRAKVIGVTGSVGKTGSKDMLRLALGGEEFCHASIGSYNNHWGVPLSLARLAADRAFAVLEMGMNHAGEISDLTRLVRPDIAIITAVEAVHLEFFASVEGIAEAKAEIFQGVVAGGVAILPRDNRYFPLLRQRALECGVSRILTFGSHIEADARLLDYAVGTEHTEVMALFGDREIAYSVGAAGKPWASNSLAVLLAADAAGVDLGLAANRLAQMAPPKGRGQRFRLNWGDGAITLIDESYNASPVSMQAAIATLGGITPGRGGRRVAVLGDMLELGAAGPELHQSLALPLQDAKIDLVFTAGPLMQGLWSSLGLHQRGSHAEDSTQLAPILASSLTSGDVVMVKGSAGSRMGLIIQFLQELAVPMAPVVNGH